MSPTLAQAQELNRFDTALIGLVDQALSSTWLAVAAVGVAVVVGAVHALAPGHGKAIAAAYLVGGRGTLRDAFALGVTVAAMHSVSVLALGLALHLLLGGAGDVDVIDRVTPALRVASGVMVIVLGAVLLLAQWRGRQRPAHHHLPPEVAPFSRRGLVVLGMAGGLLPSPSAFLVLVTASFTGRTGLGLLLVAAFSIGLAATLTAIGMAAVRGREIVLGRVTAPPRLRRTLAIGAAAAVLAGGVVLTAAGVARL